MAEPSRDEVDRTAPDWQAEEYTWDSRRLVATRLGADRTGATAQAENARQEEEFGEHVQANALAESQPAPGETCMVKDCPVDLSECKAYYRRFRICERHLKMLSLCIEGKPSRFCQQCGRFHVLEEFEGSKRSCRRALLTRFYKRRNMPVPLDVLPNMTDNEPRQGGAAKDTDTKVKPKARSSTSSDPNQVRRKRGRPRAPPIDVRDLSPDDPRVNFSAQQQAQQQEDEQQLQQQIKTEPGQDDRRGGRSGREPDAGGAGASLRGPPGSQSPDTSSGGGSGSGRGGAGGHASSSLLGRQQRSRVLRTADPLEARNNGDMSAAPILSAYSQQQYAHPAPTPRFSGAQQHSQQQEQQEQLHQHLQHHKEQQLRQALLRQLEQVEELEQQQQTLQQQAMIIEGTHRRLSAAANSSDAVADNLSRRQRHVLLLRQCSDAATNAAAAAMMGVAGGPGGGGAAAGDAADVIMSEAWQRGPPWTHGGGDSSGGHVGGSGGMARLGPMQGSTVDPLDLELLSIASESLMTDQDLPHNAGLPGSAGLVLGLPHNQQLQPQHRQQLHRHYQTLQLNSNQNRNHNHHNHQTHVLRLDADPVGISRAGYLGALTAAGSSGGPMHSQAVALRGLLGRTVAAGGAEAVNLGGAGGRNQQLLVFPGPGSTAVASNGLLGGGVGGHAVPRAGRTSGSGSDPGAVPGGPRSVSPGSGRLGESLRLAVAEDSIDRQFMEPLLVDYGVSSNTAAGGAVMGAVGLRLASHHHHHHQQQQQQQFGVLALGRSQQGMVSDGDGGGSGASLRGALLGGMGSSTRTLDLTAPNLLLHQHHQQHNHQQQQPNLPLQYRHHQSQLQQQQHRTPHHVLLLQQQQGGSGIAATPNLKDAAQSLLAQGGPRAAYTAPGSILERLNLKIYQRRPDELSPNLAEHLADLLSNADASVLQGSIRPGCTNLVLDILCKDLERLAAGLLGSEGSDPRVAAERIVQSVLSQSGLGPDIRLHMQFRDTLLAIDGGEVQVRRRVPPTAARRSRREQLNPHGASGGATDQLFSQEILGVAPLAVAAGCQFTIELLGCGLQLSGTSFHVRFRGRHLDVMPELPESKCGTTGSSVAAADSTAALGSSTTAAWDDAQARHVHVQLGSGSGCKAVSSPSGPHVVSLAVKARGPASVSSMASTASAMSSADSSAIATTGDVAHNGSSNTDGPCMGSGTSTILSAEERAVLEAMTAAVETEPFFNAQELCQRTSLRPQTGTGALSSGHHYGCSGMSPGYLLSCLEAQPTRVLARVIPPGYTMGSYLSHYDEHHVFSECGEAPICEAEGTEEWGSSEALENKPNPPPSKGHLLLNGGCECATAPPAPSGPSSVVTICGSGEGDRNDGDHGGAETEGQCGTKTFASLSAGGTTSDGDGQRWLDSASGRSTAAPAAARILNIASAAPSSEGMSGTSGSCEELRLGRDRVLAAVAVTSNNNNNAMQFQSPSWPPGRRGMGAPVWVRSEGVMDYSAGGGGGGLSTEMYISDIGDGEVTDRPSCCSQSSATIGWAPEPDVVILFVEPVPRAGLALVEAESPPKQHQSQSHPSRGVQYTTSPAAAAARVVASFYNHVLDSWRGSGGGDGGSSGSSGAAVTAGILTEWWPLVVVPAGSAPAAAEINTLKEEREQAWLRDFMVDFGLVLEALDWSRDAVFPAGEAAVNVERGAWRQTQALDRKLADPAAADLSAVVMPIGGRLGHGHGHTDEYCSATGLSAAEDVSSITAVGDAIAATSPCLSTGTWGSGAESLMRCTVGSICSTVTDVPTGIAANTGCDAGQVVISPAAEAGTTATRAQGACTFSAIQDQLLAGLSEALRQAAVAPVIEAIQAQGSLRAAAAAVASVEVSSQESAGTDAEAQRPGSLPVCPGGGHEGFGQQIPCLNLEAMSTGDLLEPGRCGSVRDAITHEMPTQPGRSGASLQQAGQGLKLLSDSGPPQHSLQGRALEEAALVYQDIIGGACGGGEGGATTVLRAGSSTRHLQSCSSQRCSEPLEMSLSLLLPPPLGELTATEAARFFGFTASAEVTCENCIVQEASDISSASEGVALDSAGATLTPPHTACDDNEDCMAVHLAAAAPTTDMQRLNYRQQQQQHLVQEEAQEEAHGRSLGTGAVVGGGAAPAGTSADGSHSAATGPAASRSEQVVAQWFDRQREELLPRARSLLVFFCNRGFHHCARLVLTFLLRSVGVSPGLVEAVTGPADDAVTAFVRSHPGPDVDVATQLDHLALSFVLLTQQVRSETGLGLLHHAVRSGSLETVDLVLQLSCRVDVPLNVLEQGPDGVTPAHLASLLPDSCTAVMEALLEYAAHATTKSLYNEVASATTAATSSHPSEVQPSVGADSDPTGGSTAAAASSTPPPTMIPAAALSPLPAGPRDDHHASCSLSGGVASAVTASAQATAPFRLTTCDAPSSEMQRDTDLEHMAVPLCCTRASSGKTAWQCKGQKKAVDMTGSIGILEDVLPELPIGPDASAAASPEAEGMQEEGAAAATHGGGNGCGCGHSDKAFWQVLQQQQQYQQGSVSTRNSPVCRSQCVTAVPRPCLEPAEVVASGASVPAAATSYPLPPCVSEDASPVSPVTVMASMAVAVAALLLRSSDTIFWLLFLLLLLAGVTLCVLLSTFCLAGTQRDPASVDTTDGGPIGQPSTGDDR